MNDEDWKPTTEEIERFHRWFLRRKAEQELFRPEPKHRFPGSMTAIWIHLGMALIGPLLVVSETRWIGQTGVAMIFIGMIGAVIHLAIREMRK